MTAKILPFKPYTVKKKKVYSYHVQIDGSCVWGNAYLEEWAGGGALTIISDYGSYDYIWTSIGPGGFKNFLLGLDKQYLLKKITRYNTDEFDLEGTLTRMRRDICEERRTQDMGVGKEDARTMWDSLKYLSGESNSEAFCAAFRDQCDLMTMELYGGDPECIPYETKIRGQVDGFYAEVWPLFCAEWRKELEEENKNDTKQ